MKGLRNKVAVTAASVVIGLLFAEGALRVSGVASPVSFHTMPANSQLRDAQTEWDVTYRTNSDGLRDEEYRRHKPGGVIRIVVIGDSFTFGQGCERGQIFPDVLEALLRSDGYPVEVVNASNIGIGPESYLIILRDIALRLGPDIVILNVFGNDASQVQPAPQLNRAVRQASHHSSLFTLLRLARRQFGAWRRGGDWQNSASNAGERGSDEAAKREKIKEFEKQYGTAVNNLLATCITEPEDVAKWVDTDEGGAGWADFQSDVEEMRELSQRQGASFIISIVPDGTQVDPHQLDIRRFLGVPLGPSTLTEKGKFQELVHGFARQHGIPTIDTLEAFREVREGLYFEADLHWTPAGHRLYAEQLARYLKQGGLLDRPNPKS